MLNLNTIAVLFCFSIVSFQTFAMMAEEQTTPGGSVVIHNNYRAHLKAPNLTTRTETELSIGLRKIKQELENVDTDGKDTLKFLAYPMVHPTARPLLGQKIQAAIKGESSAQLYIGITYLSGQVIKNDFSKAAKWLCLAALQGNPEAMLNLSLIIKKGQYTLPEQVNKKFGDLLLNEANHLVNYEKLYKGAGEGSN